MEVEHIKPSRHHGDQAGKRDNWHRRLRLRKSTLSGTEKKRKYNMKKIKKKPSQNIHTEHAVDTSSPKLILPCSKYKDGSNISPNCLQNHYENLNGEKGHAPSFHCDICNFATFKFTTLQEHHLKHKPTCETWNYNVSQSPSHLAKHYKIQHCLNSDCQSIKCKCPKKEQTECPKSTVTANSENSNIKPMTGKLNSYLLSDPVGAPKKEELFQQMTTACHRGWSRKNWWKRRGATSQQLDNKPDFKFLVPKTEVKWAPSGLFSAAGLLDENGELLNPTRTLEESKQFLERTVNSGNKWPVTLKDEPSPSYTEPLHFETKIKPCSVSLPLLGDTEKNKISALIEKSNISIPLDCTTKVVGFKMVDGKKHLILKVIPSAKTDGPLGTREESPALNLKESNGLHLNSHTESDQIHNETSNIVTKNASLNKDASTSASCQTENQGPLDPVNDISQVNNTENECSKDQSAFSDGLDMPAQPISEIEEDSNVANEKSIENQPKSPDVTLDTNDLHTCDAYVPVEVSSVRESHIQALHTKMQGDNATRKALSDKENHPELLTSQGDTCVGNLSSTMNSQLSTLMSDAVRRSSSVHHTKQTIEKVSRLSQEKGVRFECNIDPATVSSPKRAHYLPDSISEEGLSFQESGEEYSLDSRLSQVPLEQNNATIKKPFLALEESCHNADLYQTVEEPCVLQNLLNDSKLSFRDTTYSNKPDDQSTQEDDMHAPKATEMDSLQSIVYTPPMTELAMNRKRQHKPTTQNFQEPVSKAKQQFIQKSEENQSSAFYWEAIPPRVERTLLLYPVCSSQPVKVPRLHQPVVVLNHPDTDIPEVINIMRSIHRHKGAVQRVVLSQGTLKALSEFNCDSFHNSFANNSHSSHSRRVWPQRTVKERFFLKLKLKRLGSLFEVVPPGPNVNRFQASFRCWFCSRLFRNQEVWIGHGQRHLMEATRGWNELFNSSGQYNSSFQPRFN